MFKNTKVTINLKNNGGKCFQYAITLALHYEQIKKDSQKEQKLNTLTNMIVKR